MIIKNQRAQATIFIIVAVLMIAAVGVVFLLKFQQTPTTTTSPERNPGAFIESCVKEKMQENIDLVVSQGGFIEPKDFKIYNDIKTSYLCKNVVNYEPCINMHPMFFSEISKDLKNNIAPFIDECLVNLKETLEKDKYGVVFGEETEVSVNLVPNQVLLKIVKDITITKSEETFTFNEMIISFNTALYDLVLIATRIADNEARFCYFEYGGYMNLYPDYFIKFHLMSDSTKIYSIKDRTTEEEMNIAIRGCALH